MRRFACASAVLYRPRLVGSEQPADQDARPPIAARVPSRRTLHGVTLQDDYAWMRDHEAPGLLEYLAAERAYYQARTGHLAGFAGLLEAEAEARTPHGDDESVAWPLGGYLYRHRTPAGAEHGRLVRSRPGEDGEELLLDEDALAAGTGFVDVGVREPSPDGSLLAWSADTTGAELYTLRVRDLRTGRDLDESVAPTAPGVAWSADSQHLFYLVPDSLHRAHQVWRHRVGTDPADDVLVHAEGDARFELDLHTSRSGALVVITSASRDTTEVRLVPAERPEQAPTVLAARRRGVEYRVDHGDPDQLYAVTDDGVPEFRLVRAAPAPGGPERWAALPTPPGRLLSCDVFERHLLLTLRRDGAPLLAVADRDGGAVREIAARPVAGTIRVDHAESYDAGWVVVVEESLIEPPVWSALDLDTGERRELRRKEVPGYRPEAYRTERRHAPAADGTLVPVTLAHHRDTPLDGSAPCLLYGYGAYEACSDPEFDVSLPSLFDRGVVFAIAHVRGGGEGGRRWWQEGRLRRKPTTFDDFVAVADWLAGDAAGSGPLVDGSRIVSRGLSAGGLLQGAVYSRAPRRWRAVVAEVPFVDCVNSMLDPGIPLTVNEWDEWGDPRDPEDFACMRAYSPYDNPPAGERPALLVTGAVNDPRVLVHEPAKWVARLRATDTTGSTVLFRAELAAGAHTGPSGRFAHLAYESEVQAFVLDAMGLA